MVTIISPEVNDAFSLPGYMLVELTVTSERDIKFVRINIDDKDFVPLFGSKFFYPDSKTAEIAYNLKMEVLTQQTSGPYYLHVAVDDGIKLTHTYREVILNNATMIFKGFYLFTRPSVNQTSIKYFDSDFNESDFSVLNGEFTDAEISIKNDMLFVATTIPGKLTAYEFEDQLLKWTQEPEAPYPDYTDLYHDGNYLFVGYENERIAALSDLTGIQKTGTKILVDSVPMKVGIADNYFIGDFKKRTSPSRAWVSFYRLTGSLYQSYQTGISVVDFYPSVEEGAIDVIGNHDGKGILARYYFVENILADDSQVNEGEINHSCRVDDWYYLISVDKKVYHITIHGGAMSLFFENQDEIIDLRYDPILKHVFIASPDKINIYQYPDAQLLDSIYVEEEVKAIRLRYGY